jgi:hypothetical protein
MSRRDFRDPQYAAWRRGVRARDGHRCVFPGCKNTKNLKCHHIKRWQDFPPLRFSLQNGCTLCQYHHKLVTGREEEYEALLRGVVGEKSGTDAAIDILFNRYVADDGGET